MRENEFSMEMDSFLCSVRDAHIASLQLYHPSGGIRLVRWGINNRHHAFGHAIVPGTLRRLGSYPSHDVTPRCHRAHNYAAVGLELHRTKPGPVSWLGLRVTYDSDGHERVAYLWEQYHVHDPA